MRAAIAAVAALMFLTLAVSVIGSAPITLTEADNGREITLRRFALIRIRLAGNPSTGYSWEITNLDRTVIRPLKQVVERGEGNLAGRPQPTVVTLKALKRGDTTLELTYRRSWEKDVAPAKTFRIKIIVK